MEISYEKTIYQIQGKRHRLKQKEVTVCDLFRKEVMLLYEGKEIAYKLFNESKSLPKLEDENSIV